MSVSHFASRHRKDLSTDMIRTKIAHRKSLSQKENRHKEYERNRHFGLKDSNIPILESRILSSLDETTQGVFPEKANVKPRSTRNAPDDQRKQMLQKYKEEKQLQKFKEQREKAKQSVFKVGLYRPDKPDFLLSLLKPNATKEEPKKAISSSLRITRSKTKEQMAQTKIDNVQAFRPGQRSTSEKKVLDKEKKAVQLVVPTAVVRMTRSATHAANQSARTVSSTTMRKPISRAPRGNELERKSPNKGKPGIKVEAKPDKNHSSKVNDMADSQTSATNEINPDETLSKAENVPKANIGKMKGKNSFAPKDFVFQPIDGLKTYGATPVIPRGANVLTPDYTWTSLKEVDETKEATTILAEKCKTHSTETVQCDSNVTQCPLDSLAVENKEHVFNKNEATTKNSHDIPIKEVPTHERNEDQTSLPQHDVLYFRNILQSETEKLTSCCFKWDQKLELDIPDDAKDLIRTTVGQTRLLMKERFKQFEGLVNDCEFKRGEKETTCTDLDGFWDMISFQIDDVNRKFNNLSKLEESGWQQNNNNISKKVIRKKVMSTNSSKPKQEDGGRLAARHRLAAIKNAMRERIQQEEHAEAAASVIKNEVDKIVFDAGFFRIESPVKSFSGLSISSEHLFQRLRTPKFVEKAVSQNNAKMNQIKAPENLDHQSTKSDCIDKTLLSDTPENRNRVVEDAQHPRLQDFIEVNHDANKKNFEMHCLPSERMNLPLLADEVAKNINTKKTKDISDVVEGMDLNSCIIAQDILIYSPEKHTPTQIGTSQEEERKISLCQSVLFDKESLPEYHLLDSPRLNSNNSFTQMEKRPQEHARHISFGGNLISFSPVRSLNGEQSEEL